MRRTKIERNILFLCKDNACLSLMAESMAKHMRSPKIRIFSAGIRPGKIPPEVRRVMQEIGVEQSGQQTKSMDRSSVPTKSIWWCPSKTPMRQCGSLPRQSQDGKVVDSEPDASRRARVRLSLNRYRRGIEMKSTNECSPCSWTTGAISL